MEEAQTTQFRLIECVCAHFDGRSLLSSDLGVTPACGRPETTQKVEAVLADFFGTEGAALTQGAGTGAIRAMLSAALRAGEMLLIHEAPQYQTTQYTFETMGLNLARTNFNCLEELQGALAGRSDLQFAYVQHARHRPEDSYLLGDVLRALRQADLRALTDENYTVFKVPEIGVELGADASTFSLFKLLGPEGIGCIVGREDIISRVHTMNYSGGGQVQGHQALDALRSLALVPLLWAVQSMVVDEVAARLKGGEVQGVRAAEIANAQDRLVLVLLDEPIARSVVEVSARFGAQNYPVGANSRYEIAPWFYRLSGSFLDASPELADYAIRVNPVRAGTDLTVDILRRSISAARSEL
ncbi:MAG: aminotransferase class V-fold PLP-dependent enzyme [Chloroflexota bacterium]|nr:MAG: aminotransferase [Chloroflexota bacterium]